ncbi:hydroxysqualene dehydroxylase HpnE [Limnohabitans sp.]|uniref:hydroxysqualene dehydroxylase HpnE n=1 Tax=Limnohabitans sp. TaxID=1907725 RepID=UPI00286EE1E8|nr:hydroxysqualene dehydroxylase HpnE [Limnohabitans sp.]
MKQLTIVGAGWAGLAAAVAATQAGWRVQLYEAAHIAGGRARSLPQSFAGKPLDNGQHILIGAYRDTLTLMRTVGLNPEVLLQRIPLDLRFANGQGLSLPNWPSPLNLLAGLSRAQGWTLKDKVSLTLAAWGWQRAEFECDMTWTVAQLCDASGLSRRVMNELIEPLCLSALNTPLQDASAAVFLRVLHDALLGGAGSSDLLVPRVDLGALLPEACLQWLWANGAEIHLGTRTTTAQLKAMHQDATPDNAVLLACPPWEAARLTADIAPVWSTLCAELPFTAIATVYLHCKDDLFKGLTRPMVALHSDAKSPAQFVFDKGALSTQHGLLAAVVSACTAERDDVTEQVHAQVCEQLELLNVEVVQTIVEKRATLACTPMLDRPASFVADGLWACGDYIRGPYPSTLEGAVRSGQQVITQLSQVTHR